jgi:hypothetical protein
VRISHIKEKMMMMMMMIMMMIIIIIIKGADKSLARPGRKQSTATEDFEFHISYL